MTTGNELVNGRGLRLAGVLVALPDLMVWQALGCAHVAIHFCLLNRPYDPCGACPLITYIWC